MLMVAVLVPVSPVVAVELYLDGLVDKDLTRMPLADRVYFEDPLLPEPVTGKAAAFAFLERFLPAINAIEIERHVVDGEFVGTQWTADTTFGRIPIFEVFRVVDGLIVEMRAYFDPRPITSAG